MSVISINTSTTGLVGVAPRIVEMVSTDNLATITTAGYLNRQGQVLQGFSIYPTDEIHVIYSYVASTNSGIFGIFLPTITSNGQITLSQWIDAGNVLLPVVSGNLASFNGTTGQIQDSGVAASNVMTLSGTNVMTGTGRIIAVKANGTEASNAVTANGMAGIITTSSLTTAGGASYAITWTNSYISLTSTIQLSMMGGTNTVPNFTLTATAGSGTSTLTIHNNTASTVLNGTILIGYLIM